MIGVVPWDLFPGLTISILSLEFLNFLKVPRLLVPREQEHPPVLEISLPVSQDHTVVSDPYPKTDEASVKDQEQEKNQPNKE